jgi:Arc/MetJ-type ribon-helix-helix transcriptional regulator
MSTLSVPISQGHETFIDEMIQRGVAPTKAEVVRQALTRFAEDQAVEAVQRAEQEIRDGKTLRGNLRHLAARLP